MSRHLWRARSHPASETRSGSEPQPLSIFADTVRAVTGQAGQPAPAPPVPAAAAGPAAPAADREEADFPAPRPARNTAEATRGPDEITVEIPRCDYSEEPADPALSLISLGRHGMR
jgi:hypothetical protein